MATELIVYYKKYTCIFIVIVRYLYMTDLQTTAPYVIINCSVKHYSLYPLRPWDDKMPFSPVQAILGNRKLYNKCH